MHKPRSWLLVLVASSTRHGDGAGSSVLAAHASRADATLGQNSGRRWQRSGETPRKGGGGQEGVEPIVGENDVELPCAIRPWSLHPSRRSSHGDHFDEQQECGGQRVRMRRRNGVKTEKTKEKNGSKISVGGYHRTGFEQEEDYREKREEVQAQKKKKTQEESAKE